MKIYHEGKDYTVSYDFNGDMYSCRVIDIDVFYCAKTIEDVTRLAKGAITAHIRHYKIPGMKHLKVFKAPQVNLLGVKFDVNFLTPYLSRSWFFGYRRYTFFKGFRLRLLGFDINVREKNAMEKLIKRAHEGAR